MISCSLEKQKRFCGAVVNVVSLGLNDPQFNTWKRHERTTASKLLVLVPSSDIQEGYLVKDCLQCGS